MFLFPNILFRVLVALKTKGHTQGLCMVDHFHLVHLTMTVHTTDSAVYVDRMVEISVVGQLVNLYPFDGFSRLVMQVLLEGTLE